MTIATFKDLCLDATDALALGRFWQRVLGATFVDLGDASARLDPGPGRPPAELIWVNRVPEPRTGPTRVHLDLRLPGPDPRPLLDAGAELRREPGGDIAWWVLADPEGNEFCAFAPRDDSAPGAFELVVAATDPGRQAAWWATVVGGALDPAGDGATAAITGGAGFGWTYWVFDRVPEAKTVKNRMHWDVTLTDDTPDALIDAGATLLRERGGDIAWWVLADPEGNEFCAFAPRR
jgi:catechol 2,3-dioxygenase-like lactoylglutathione lyase family enzyme